MTFKIDGATMKKIEPSIPVEPQSLRVKPKSANSPHKANWIYWKG